MPSIAARLVSDRGGSKVTSPALRTPSGKRHDDVGGIDLTVAGGDGHGVAAVGDGGDHGGGADIEPLGEGLDDPSIPATGKNIVWVSLFLEELGEGPEPELVGGLGVEQPEQSVGGLERRPPGGAHELCEPLLEGDRVAHRLGELRPARLQGSQALEQLEAQLRVGEATIGPVQDGSADDDLAQLRRAEFDPELVDEWQHR